MKVTQENPQAFKPVTITLETREELEALEIILYSVNYIEALGDNHELLDTMYQLHSDLYQLTL